MDAARLILRLWNYLRRALKESQGAWDRLVGRSCSKRVVTQFPTRLPEPCRFVLGLHTVDEVGFEPIHRDLWLTVIRQPHQLIVESRRCAMANSSWYLSA